MPSPVSPRKKPIQARSRKTVEAILAATSRILVKEGYQAATTTRVAEVAGVSIGSLYQYFPTREALVAALVDEHVSEILNVLAKTAAVPEDESLETTVRSFVRTVLAMHAVDPELHAVITQNFARVEGFEKIEAFSRQAEVLVRAALEKNRHRLRDTNFDMLAFILVYAVQGVVNACVLPGAPRYDDESLCDELTLLVLRTVERPPASNRKRPGDGDATAQRRNGRKAP